MQTKIWVDDQGNLGRRFGQTWQADGVSGGIQSRETVEGNRRGKQRMESVGGSSEGKHSRNTEGNSMGEIV